MAIRSINLFYDTGRQRQRPNKYDGSPFRCARKYEVKYKKYQEGKDEIELKYMNLIHAEIIKNK